jgi:hypothetical protein
MHDTFNSCFGVFWLRASVTRDALFGVSTLWGNLMRDTVQTLVSLATTFGVTRLLRSYCVTTSPPQSKAPDSISTNCFTDIKYSLCFPFVSDSEKGL